MGNRNKSNRKRLTLSVKRKNRRRMFKLQQVRRKFFEALGLVRKKSEKNIRNEEALFNYEENAIFLKEDPLAFVIPEETVPRNVNVKEEIAENDPYSHQLHHVKEEEEEILPQANQEMDLVDLMFLDYAKRFKMISNNRQILVNTRLCQVLSEAEFAEIEERRSLNYS